MTFWGVHSPTKKHTMNLKVLRKQRGLTQKQLSQRTGIPRTVLSEYENGVHNINQMTLANALKLAHALNVSTEELAE